MLLGCKTYSVAVLAKEKDVFLALSIGKIRKIFVVKKLPQKKNGKDVTNEIKKIYCQLPLLIQFQAIFLDMTPWF